MKTCALGLGLALLVGAQSSAIAQTVTGRTTDKGWLSPLGAMLDDNGIRVRSQLVDEYAGNPNGAVHQGARNVGQFQFGVSLDLKKIFGWDGAMLHMTYAQDYGHGLSHDVLGTFTKAQEIYKNQYDVSRLGVFALEQKLFNNSLDIFVGRLGETTFYGRLANTCYFQSGITCSVPQILNSETGFSFPTSAAWGGNVRWHFVRGAYVEAGAFEVDPNEPATNGLNWSTNHATGIEVPIEISTDTWNLDKYRYPGTIRAGAYVSTAPLSDIYYNTQHRSIGTYGGAARIDPATRSGAYILAEKAVWRPTPHDNQNLTMFAGEIDPFDREEIMSNQMFVGGVLRAPFASRIHDIFSVVANYYRMSAEEQAFLRDSRKKAGGSGSNSRNEFTFEADYNVLVWRSTRLAPNLLYIVNPENSAIPKTKILPRNALVLGVKFTVNFTGLFGLPLAPNLSD